MRSCPHSLDSVVGIWEAQIWSQLQLLFKDVMQNGTASATASGQTILLTAMGPETKHLSKG